jgi:tetrahydromethanopterin S-methyltransferase subunit D
MLYQLNEKMNELLFGARANGFSTPRIKKVPRTLMLCIKSNRLLGVLAVSVN